MYTAVVLDFDSQEKLKQAFAKYVPDTWDLICHHMTTNMGKAKPEVAPFLGRKVEIHVISFGHDDKVAAVGVECEIHSDNPKKHITVAVNRSGGGKPVMSNHLTNWVPVLPLVLQGIVVEVQ